VKKLDKLFGDDSDDDDVSSDDGGDKGKAAKK
jgi:hypothetical protein